MGSRSFDPAVGLCSMCEHVRRVESGKGATFWLCDLSKSDSRFRKYPPLPVSRCAGFQLYGGTPLSE